MVQFVLSAGGRKEARGKGRFVALRLSSSRLVVSSSRRFVVSFRRLASFRFRFRFVGREERGGGKKGGTQDKLNQKGSNRPLEDALKSNFGRLLSTPPLKFSLVLPFLSTLLLGFFWSLPSLYENFCRLEK